MNSWVEQRLFVTQAPALLEQVYPALAKNLSAALDLLAHPVVPTPEGMKAVVSPVGAALQCGAWTVKLGSSGAMTSLVRKDKPSVDWASESKPIGEFRYQTFTSGDFNVFLKDFGSRIGDKGVWPEHTPGHYADFNYSTSDMQCGNFCKKNMSSARPTHRELTPTMSSAWHSGNVGGCKILTKAMLPQDVRVEAGAPAEVVVEVTIEGSTLDWAVVMVDKRPTRLAESVFFSFDPAVAEPEGWTLQVLGSQMDPTDTLGKLGETEADSIYGGSPHLRGVEAARWKGVAGAFTLTSLDVPVLCTGKASPFVTPRTQPPDMSQGVHWNVFQNIWNTK